MTDSKLNGGREHSAQGSLPPTFAGRRDLQSMTKDRLPEGSIRPDMAYQLIADEMNLEGNPALNLRIFATTWMEPEARKLMAIGANKYLVDEDEYPQLKIIEDRIIQMEAALIDENSIPVGAILGTTFSGQVDDIPGINALPTEHKARTGQDIPIHVDAASGGFVVPFQRIADAVMTNARFLEQALVATGHFDILNDTRYLPVVVVRLRPGHAFDCFQIADELRKFGWTAPAYALPPAAQDTVVLSLVVKENFSRELAEKLLRDIDSCLCTLEQRGAVGAAGGAEQAAPHGVADPEYGRPHAQAAAPAAGGTERRIPSDPCGYSDP